MEVLEVIERKYGVDSPKPIVARNLKDYVQVEKKQEKLKDSEEFLLYLLRRFTNGMCPSQERIAELMGTERAFIAKGMKVLEQAGFISIYKKRKGRSNGYTLLKLPSKDYNKIPCALILNTEIPWRKRLFAIKLYDEVLYDVNEIHRTKKELAKIIGISRPSLDENLKYYEDRGLIEKIKVGYRIDVFGLLSITEDTLFQQERKISLQEIEIDSLNQKVGYWKDKYDKVESDFTVIEARYSNPNYWRHIGLLN